MPAWESSERNCLQSEKQIMLFCVLWGEQKILEFSGVGDRAVSWQEARGAQGPDILPPLLAVVCCLSCYCTCVQSLSVCLSPSPQCDARLFWVCLCFSSPRASIQGQRHSRCSLLSSGHVQSANPQYVQFVSLHLSGHLRCRSCPVHAPYIPVSDHKSVSRRDNGVDRTLSFRRHTVIVGPHVTARVIGC